MGTGFEFKCKNCNRTHLQKNPLVRDRKSITLTGEMYILDRLRNPRKTFQDVADEFYIPKTSVIRVFDSYVNISRHPLGKVLCFDEFYAKKLTKTKYCFGIYDFLSKEVIDILDDFCLRHKCYYKTPEPAKLTVIATVTLDHMACRVAVLLLIV